MQDSLTDGGSESEQVPFEVATPFPNRWTYLLVLIPSFLALLLSAFESLFLPFGLDQGWFARVADIILEGGLPFRDAWEVKSPATHYTYALAEILFGRSTMSIRIIDLLFLAVGLFALLRIGRGRDQVGLFVGLAFFGSFHLKLGYWDGAQPDPWAAISVLVALAVIHTPGSDEPAPIPSSKAFVAGCLVGLAGLYKLPYLALGAPVAVAALQNRLSIDGARAIAWIGAGALSVLGACIAWFAWQGALTELLDIQLGFNLRVHSAQIDLSPANHLGHFAEVLSAPTFAVQIPFFVLGLWRLRRSNRRSFSVWTSWILTAVGLLILQGRYYHYQQALLFAPFAYLAGLGVVEAAHRMRAAARKQQRADWNVEIAIALMLVVIFVIALPRTRTRGFKTYVLESWDRTTYLKTFSRGVIWAPQHAYALAAELAARTEAGDSFFIWGLAPGAHYLASRPSPSRFASSYPLIAGKEAGYRDRYRAEFLRSIEANPPRVIAIAVRDANALYPGTSWQHYLRFDAFREFVETRYTPVAPVSNFRLFERRDAQSPTRDGHDR